MNKKQTLLFMALFVVLLINPASCFVQTWINGITSADSKLEEQLFVNVDEDDYYSYEVYSKEGNIIIQVLDEDLKVWKLDFCKQPNNLYFLDAYKNFIVVEERKPGATVSYWVLQIVEIKDCIELKAFAVSSRVDNEGYDISFAYKIRDIVEYDEEKQDLYVSVVSWEDFSIYRISICEQSKVLITVNWFNWTKTCKESIQAGNSRILLEQNSNTFWVDSNNTRKSATDPTIYIKTPICKLTDKPIYDGGSQVFNLIDWYFQFISESADHCKLTAFVVSGYCPILSCQYTLTSATPFKYFGDGYNFFIAVSSNDIYLTNIYRQDGCDKYELYTNLLSNEIKDPKCRADIIADFAAAKVIIFHDNRFYLLTGDKYVVYGGCRGWFSKLYERKLTSALTCADDPETVLQNYMNSCKNNFSDYVNNKNGNLSTNYSNKKNYNDNYSNKNNYNDHYSNVRNYNDNSNKKGYDNDYKSKSNSNSGFNFRPNPKY